MQLKYTAAFSMWQTIAPPRALGAGAAFPGEAEDAGGGYAGEAARHLRLSPPRRSLHRRGAEASGDACPGQIGRIGLSQDKHVPAETPGFSGLLHPHPWPSAGDRFGDGEKRRSPCGCCWQQGRIFDMGREADISRGINEQRLSTLLYKRKSVDQTGGTPVRRKESPE
jgi:hypothetical protein